MNELESSVESSSAFLSGGYLNVIATAAVIIVVTFVVSELAVRAMRKAYHVAADTEKAASILILGIRIVVWAIGAYMLCKNCFNIDLSVVVGALGVGGLALSLGLQDTIKNILGGAKVDGGILWCVTELVSKETLDEVVSIEKEVQSR